ncbi:MAG TPA: HAMP domain-containing sensor histidine kinase [Bacteroidales bacterium]|nr:HAMP domain-containing sensor histidine kinase [Bacteroidales bacterium]
MTSLQQTTGNILYGFQRYVLSYALTITSIGLFIDIIQQLKVFSFYSNGTNPTFIYIHQNINVFILNLVSILIIVLLSILVFKRMIRLSLAALLFSVIIIVNTAVPYYWISQAPNAITGFILRDMLFFIIIIAIVSINTPWGLGIYVSMSSVLLYAIIAIYSKNIFLLENIPLISFMIIGLALYLWKMNKILFNIVSRQNAERKQIEELSQFKEKMHSMLFHDIKVPLNNIIALIGKSPQLSHLEQVSSQALNVKHLLDNMIDIAASDNATLKTNPVAFKVSPLLEKIVQQTRLSAEAKEIELTYSFGIFDFTIWADMDLIERAILNIVDNAIKFSPKKGVITINVFNESGFIEFHIIDNGPGIKEDEMDKIFELFYYAQHTEQTKRSSGIGLAFCKMVAETYKGSVYAQNRNSGGCEFVFKIPICVSEFQKIERTHTPAYSTETLALFNPIVPQLQNVKFYHTSEIYQLLNEVKPNDNHAILNEYNQLREMALSCDKNQFKKFIEMLS